MNLIIDLSNKSEDFILGMEVGKLWSMMRSGLLGDISTSGHIVNKEVIQQLAESSGYDVTFVERDDGVWMDVNAHKLWEEGSPFN